MSSSSSSPPSSDEDFTPSLSFTSPGSDSEPEVPQSPPASAPTETLSSDGVNEIVILLAENKAKLDQSSTSHVAILRTAAKANQSKFPLVAELSDEVLLKEIAKVKRVLTKTINTRTSLATRAIFKLYDSHQSKPPTLTFFNDHSDSSSYQANPSAVVIMVILATGGIGKLAPFPLLAHLTQTSQFPPITHSHPPQPPPPTPLPPYP